MTAGLTVLRATAVATGIGGFAMDWNRTHLFNPRWTPHARFHDAMTISLGAALGASGLWYLRRPHPSPEDLLRGAVAPALFWAAQGAAFLFPGAEGLESEFPRRIPKVGGVWLNERFASGLMLTIAAASYLAEARAGAGGSARSR